MAQRLTHSDEVEVWYKGGWWLATFLGTRPSAGRRGMVYHVRSDMYQVERWVSAKQVRPHWKRWGSTWRQLEQFRKKPRPKATQQLMTEPTVTVTGTGSSLEEALENPVTAVVRALR